MVVPVPSPWCSAVTPFHAFQRCMSEMTVVVCISLSLIGIFGIYQPFTGILCVFQVLILSPPNQHNIRKLSYSIMK